MSKTCPICNTASISEDEQTCPVCGASLDQPTEPPGDGRLAATREPDSTPAVGPEDAGPELAAQADQTNGSSAGDQPGDNPPPESGQPESSRERPTLAWEMSGPFFSRLWLTCWQVLFQPEKSFKRLGPHPGRHAFWFVFWITEITYIVGIPFGTVNFNQQSLFALWVEHEDFTVITPVMMQISISVVMFVLLGPVLTWISIHAFAGLFHLFLRLYKSSKHPYRTTYKTVTYWFAAYLGIFALTSIPLNIVIPLLPAGTGATVLKVAIWIGFLLLMVWQVANLMIAIASAQETTRGRALLAWFSIIALFVLFGLLIYISAAPAPSNKL